MSDLLQILTWQSNWILWNGLFFSQSLYNNSINKYWFRPTIERLKLIISVVFILVQNAVTVIVVIL